MKHSEARAALEAIDWNEATKRLTLYAKKRLGRRGTLSDAQDLAFEAIRRIFDPDYADWDPQQQPDVMSALGSIVNGLIRNQVRKAASIRERPMSAQRARALQNSPSSTPGPEHALIAAEDQSRAFSALETRIAGDEVCEQILSLWQDGIEKPAEQAQRLGVPIRAIYNARRRLSGHLDAVRAELAEERGDDETP